MIRGTTPTYTITVEDMTDLSGCDVYVSLSQGGHVITKHGQDLSVVGNQITFVLSQADTLGMEHGYASVQVRGYVDGSAWATNTFTIPVEPVLDEREIPLE